MTYDDWKTTEPEYAMGIVCDCCRVMVDELDATHRDGEWWCLECYDKRYGADDEGSDNQEGETI